MKGKVYKFHRQKLVADSHKLCQLAKIGKLPDVLQEHHSLHGNWQESIFVDGKQTWDFDQQLTLINRCRVFAAEDCLASDSRCREDIEWLVQGNIPNAEQWKFQLEEMQRHNEKLRKGKH